MILAESVRSRWRPEDHDSITAEKLSVLSENGVTRISINPQTMNDDTLIRIGRKHTAEDVADCFQTARKSGALTISIWT